MVRFCVAGWLRHFLSSSWINTLHTSPLSSQKPSQSTLQPPAEKEVKPGNLPLPIRLETPLARRLIVMTTATFWRSGSDSRRMHDIHPGDGIDWARTTTSGSERSVPTLVIKRDVKHGPVQAINQGGRDTVHKQLGSWYDMRWVLLTLQHPGFTRNERERGTRCLDMSYEKKRI